MEKLRILILRLSNFVCLVFMRSEAKIKLVLHVYGD